MISILRVSLQQQNYGWFISKVDDWNHFGSLHDTDYFFANSNGIVPPTKDWTLPQDNPKGEQPLPRVARVLLEDVQAKIGAVEMQQQPEETGKGSWWGRWRRRA